MNIDGILEVCVEMEINENIGAIKDIVNRLGRMPWDTAKKFLKQKAREFVAFAKDDPYIDENNVLRIINTRFGTHFSDVNSIFAKGLVESVDRVDEGLKDWWNEAAKNMYGALSFYPLLTAFLEFDKIIKGTGDANIRSMVIYFLVWILIISGKVVSGLINKPGEEKDAGNIIGSSSLTSRVYLTIYDMIFL
jgi:hypothetical protein